MRKKNIFIVDDNAEFAEGLALLLTAKGYNAFTLNTVDEAIAITDSVIPDAVVVDIIMPQKYGYELIYHIKTHYLNLPVIAISGGNRNLATHYFLDFAEVLGANHVLKKPFEIKELTDIIDKYEPIFIVEDGRKNRE